MSQTITAQPHVRPPEMSDALVERAINLAAYKRNPARCTYPGCTDDGGAKLAFDRRFYRYCECCEAKDKDNRERGRGRNTEAPDDEPINLNPDGSKRKSRRGRRKVMDGELDINQLLAQKNARRRLKGYVPLLGFRSYLDRNDYTYKDVARIANEGLEREGIEGVSFNLSTLREWSNLTARCKEGKARILARVLPDIDYEELVTGRSVSDEEECA